MTDPRDPTLELRAEAKAFPETEEGTSCNQTSFKTGGKSFLFVGPGPKGKGFKAMFKLHGDAMEQAQELAAETPRRIEVGSTGWVTARFTREEPLPRSLWQPWLRASYEVSRPQRAKRKKPSGTP